MTEFIKKYKGILIILLGVLFSVYVINGIYEHSIIPDHIHSIDDKAENERTDEDKIVILERSLQKEPGKVDVMLQLSDLYIKTDNKKSAKKMLNKILEIDPSNKEAGELLKKSE